MQHFRNALLILAATCFAFTAGCALPGDTASPTPVATLSVVQDAPIEAPTPEPLAPDVPAATLEPLAPEGSTDAAADATDGTSPTGAPASSGPVAFPTSGYCNGEGVNLRAQPDTEADIVDVMGQNAALEVLSQEGEWYSVTADGQSAYVSTALVTLGPPPRKDNMRWAKVTQKEAQAYGAPTETDVREETKLKKDDVLKVLRTIDGYVHVVYDKSVQCYVKEASVEFITKDEYDAALSGG